MGQDSSIEFEMELIGPAVVELKHPQSPDGWMEEWMDKHKEITCI